MGVDGERVRDGIATTREDLPSSSFETRNIQEGANEVADESMRLERATALCWRFMTLRLQPWNLTPGASFEQDTGIGLNIVSSLTLQEDSPCQSVKEKRCLKQATTSLKGLCTGC